jgi:Sec-independent protein secretion pathway component TatC
VAVTLSCRFEALGSAATVLIMSLYDLVLWVHVTAVITAFGALFAYPVFLAVNARAPISQRAGLHRAQIAFSKRVTGPAIGIVLLAGIYLASDADLWSKVWVIVPLVLLFVIAGLGVTVLRRGEERLEAAADAADEPAYVATLASVRLWTLVTLALIVLAIFFMAGKPFD